MLGVDDSGDLTGVPDADALVRQLMNQVPKLITPSQRLRREELNDRQRKILTVMESGKRIRAPEAVALFGEAITERTIRNDLQGLVKLGLIQRRGQGPSTMYELIEKGETP